MRQTQTPWSRRLTLATLFSAYSAIIAMVAQVIVTPLFGASVTGETLTSAAVGGVGIFVVSFLTVLFLWPRIGFDPFPTRSRKTS